MDVPPSTCCEWCRCECLYELLFQHCFSTLSGLYPGVDLLRLTFGTRQSFPWQLYHLTFLLATYEVSSRPTCSPAGSSYITLTAALVGMKGHLIVVSLCISLVTHDTGLPLRCSLAICISFLEKYLSERFVHFLIGSFVFVVEL